MFIVNVRKLLILYVCEQHLTLIYLETTNKMPKVRRSKKAPPEGWELIEPTLDELEQKMREGVYSY